MQPEHTLAAPAAAAPSADVSIESIVGIRERTTLQKVLMNQAFWVTVAVALICTAIAQYEPAFS